MAVLLEVKPASFVTAGYVGQPGRRVFYLQAAKGRQVVTLIVEKQQVEALAYGLRQFVAELSTQFPELPAAEADYAEEVMKLRLPLDPDFRVGQLGLGYDQDSDLVMIVAQEVMTENRAEDDLSRARLFATRAQALALAAHSLAIIRQGRRTCGNCGQPMDPAGHFCPRSNGHKY